ncbi:HK97 family phage major capsid protein, partial [Reticulomyxa filosa]
MSITEMTDKINELAANWEQFKVVNERRLKEIEKKGLPDPLTEEQLKKLNLNIDTYRQSLQNIETALNLPKCESNPAYESTTDIEHKNAFINYIRKGNVSELLNYESKGISALVDSESGWTQEVKDFNDGQAVQLTKKTTQKLIDDPRIDIEVWVSQKLVDVFARKENAAFIHGDGAGKPRGILTYEEGKEWGKIEQIHSGSTGKITAEGLIKLFFSLKEIFSVKAKFLMSRDAIQAVRMLKDAISGKYLWQPGLEANVPDTILGAEVIQSADMPNTSENSLVIAYADFKKAYHVVDRQGIRILRDPYTNKPYVKFYTTKRVGGDV